MSTRKAFKICFLCLLIIAKNICKAIDRFVRRFPWGCIIFLIMVSIVVDYIYIHNARSERDTLSYENYKMQTTIDSLKIAREANTVRNRLIRNGTPIKLGVASKNN